MKEDLYPKRNILSIDLKSFFASCECVARGLDPFKVPLVVANPEQKGAITLAVTPYLKAQGVPSRGRIYEIPKNIKYEIVPPHMSLYIKMSKEVINIYLDYVAKEDLHIYSIDECFLDVTNYLKLYKKTDYELAEEILNTITKKTGLTATCGIGPNILLAKVAMDTEAKKYKNGIAKWTYEDVQTKLWSITPLSKMWGIGPGLERRLNNLGIKSIGELARFNKDILKHHLGVIGIELYEHANGIDTSRIQELSKETKEKSYSNSQVLFKDYHEDNIKIIIREMVEIVTKRLRSKNNLTGLIGLSIGYSRQYGGGFYHNIKLEVPTDNINKIYETCLLIFDKYYNGSPIRQVGVSEGNLSPKDNVQLNIFEDIESIEKEDKKNKVIDELNERFGKNSVLKASSLLQDSTIKERNKKIGGHSE